MAEKTITLSPLSYSTKGVRRGPLKPELVDALVKSVTAVYGPDYRVDVMSASQPWGPKRTPGTTGTRRHGTQAAADVWVYDPNGRLGSEPSPMACKPEPDALGEGG